MRTRPTLAMAALAAALLFPPDVRAQESRPLDPTPFLRKDWYGVYLKNDKVGFAEVSASREMRGEVPTVEIGIRLTLKFVMNGEKVEMRIEERNVFASAGLQELLEAHSVQTSSSETVERTGTREKDGFVLRTKQGKEQSEQETVPLPRETLSDYFCAEGLAFAGATAGTKRKVPSFDLDDGTETENEFEVVGVDVGFAGGIRTKEIEIRQTDGKTGEKCTVRVSSRGTVREAEFAGAFVIRQEPEALAKDLQYSGDLFTKGLLHIARKLGDPRAVRALVLRLRGADPALKLPSDARQTVTKAEDGALLVTFRFEVAREGLPAVADGDSRDALRSTTEYPCTNPEIQALARKAVGDAANPEEKVRRLVAFVDGYVEDEDCNTSLSALDVLRNRKGDCSEHTVLFIALCRALGVPAREITGLMYGGDELGAFGGHAWAEVALDGRWVSADPTWGEFPVDATHIKLDEGDKGENGLRFLVGAIKAEVASVETAK